MLELFTLKTPLIELVLRGVVIYGLLFLFFRILARHEVVSLGIVEMLVLVLVADFSQNAMAGESTSLVESAVLAGSMLASHQVVRLAYALRHSLLRRRRARRAVA